MGRRRAARKPPRVKDAAYTAEGRARQRGGGGARTGGEGGAGRPAGGRALTANACMRAPAVRAPATVPGGPAGRAASARRLFNFQRRRARTQGTRLSRANANGAI